MNDNETTQQCPFCGETIKKAAVKCRFCHEWLVTQDAASTNEITPPPESENTHLAPTKKINPVATNTQFLQKTPTKKLLIVVSLVLLILLTVIIFGVGWCIIEQKRIQRIEQAALIDFDLDASGTMVVKYRGVATHIEIPQGVTSIGDSAFLGCSRLVNIVIPDSVTSIGNNAFENCSSLEKIIIPDSVTHIGDDILKGCKNLTSIRFPNSLTSLGNNIHFEGYSQLRSITLPDNITSIETGAFLGCSNLTSITIPKSVKSISDGAFVGVKKVELAQGNNNFALDEKGVLIDTQNRKLLYCPPGIYGSYIILDSVTSIGDSAFEYCKSLTSITIPNSVTSIGKSAFLGCDSLTSITIPNSVTEIGGYAFYYCKSLTSITIPNSVTSIGDGAFAGVKKVELAQGNNNFALNKKGVLINTKNRKLLYCPPGIDGSYIIPDSVTSIGDSAFSNCDILTSITILNSVTSIGNWAFEDCKSLTSITIPNSVTSIGYSVFANCNRLTSITIPRHLSDQVHRWSLPRACKVFYH